MSRSITELLLNYDIKELHVSFTHGLWRYEKWGYPVIDAAPGAEIWAWFDSTLSEEKIDEQWKLLCGTLSGLFCASLNFINEANTIKPKYSFRPQYADGRPLYNESSIRYSTLPREIVCTENLTPWKKLLPCSNDEGFASLLNSGYIHNTNYHSLGIHIRSLCDIEIDNCKTSHLEIKQTVNLIHDTQILNNNRDWSIRKLFGQGLNGACDLSESSKIYVDITDKDYQLTPEPKNLFISQRGGATTKFAEYNVKESHPNKMFNIAGVYGDNSNLVYIASTPPLYAKRFLLGVGQERGKIVTKITNTHWASLNVLLQENIPWFCSMYLHSLKIKSIDNRLIKPVAVSYIPGQQRERQYHLEVAFKIPARSTIELSIEFDYMFLKWLEYPPDANHGQYIGSAILTAQLPVARNFTAIPIDGSLFADSFNATRTHYLIQIRTESLLITLATPDFSMPYNVICLTCTVVALAFGPIHNISTKNIVIPKKDKDKSLLGKLKQLLFKK